jgi:hypothetical protein
MASKNWSATYEPASRRTLGATWLSGPGVDALVLDIVQTLAAATDPEDGLADAWEAYATARRAVLEASRYGEPTEAELDDEAIAWDTLVMDLGAAVRVPRLEVGQVSAVLAGRPRRRASRWFRMPVRVRRQRVRERAA